MNNPLNSPLGVRATFEQSPQVVCATDDLRRCVETALEKAIAFRERLGLVLAPAPSPPKENAPPYPALCPLAQYLRDIEASVASVNRVLDEISERLCL